MYTFGGGCGGVGSLSTHKIKLFHIQYMLFQWFHNVVTIGTYVFIEIIVIKIMTLIIPLLLNKQLKLIVIPLPVLNFKLFLCFVLLCKMGISR